MSFQLLIQQKLMGESPAQPIDIVNEESLDLPAPYQFAQRGEGRTA